LSVWWVKPVDRAQQTDYVNLCSSLLMVPLVFQSAYHITISPSVVHGTNWASLYSSRLWSKVDIADYHALSTELSNYQEGIMLWNLQRGIPIIPIQIGEAGRVPESQIFNYRYHEMVAMISSSSFVAVRNFRWFRCNACYFNFPVSNPQTTQVANLVTYWCQSLSWSMAPGQNSPEDSTMIRATAKDNTTGWVCICSQTHRELEHRVENVSTASEARYAEQSSWATTTLVLEQTRQAPKESSTLSIHLS